MTDTTNTDQLTARLDQLQATQERMAAQLEATIQSLLRNDPQRWYTAPTGLQLYTEIANSLRDNGVNCPEYFDLPPSTVNLIETKAFLLEELLTQLNNLVAQLDVIRANADYRGDGYAAHNVDLAKATVLDDVMPIICELGVRP